MLHAQIWLAGLSLVLGLLLARVDALALYEYDRPVAGALAGAGPKMPPVGRVKNAHHDEIFAQQAKELEKTKSKERKPYLACPVGLIPCLVSADAETARDDVYECMDMSSSLQSCGGCSMRRNQDSEVEEGDGQDCTALPNVRSVECVASRCVITACKMGYRQTNWGCI